MKEKLHSEEIEKALKVIYKKVMERIGQRKILQPYLNGSLLPLLIFYAWIWPQNITNV